MEKLHFKEKKNEIICATKFNRIKKLFYNWVSLSVSPMINLLFEWNYVIVPGNSYLYINTSRLDNWSASISDFSFRVRILEKLYHYRMKKVSIQLEVSRMLLCKTRTKKNGYQLKIIIGFFSTKSDFVGDSHWFCDAASQSIDWCSKNVSFIFNGIKSICGLTAESMLLWNLEWISFFSRFLFGFFFPFFLSLFLGHWLSNTFQFCAQNGKDVYIRKSFPFSRSYFWFYFSFIVLIMFECCYALNAKTTTRQR